MTPEQDPLNAGQALAQGIPGVNILMMLRKLGEQAPDSLQQALKLLGLGQQVQGQNYPVNAPLPRYGGQDQSGNPIIVPPGQ